MNEGAKQANENMHRQRLEATNDRIIKLLEAILAKLEATNGNRN